MSSRLGIAFVTAAVSLVVVQAASAASYCVAPNTTCGGTNVATLQEALDAAAVWTDNDRIYLGATTYVAPAGGFKYQPSVSPVEIAGAGQGKTVITGAPGSGGTVLTVTGGGAGIHDVTITLPASALSGSIGLDTDAWVEHVTVNEDATQAHADRSGIELRDWGQLHSTTVALTTQTGWNTKGVWTNSGTVAIWGSVITAQTAVATGYNTTIGDSRLKGGTGVSVYSGTTTVTHTLIEGTGWDWYGLSVGNQSTGDTVVNADGLLIHGSGYGTPVGVGASTFLNPDRNVDVNVTNSVIRDATHSLSSYAKGSAHAKIAISYSDFDPATESLTGGNAFVDSTHATNLGAAAGFADPAAGDYHLQPGSPLIDAGNPSSPVAYIDLDGNAPDTDGDGDGVVRRDVGPFEAPTAPLKPVTQPDPGPVPAADPAPQPDPGDPLQPGPAAKDTQPPVLSRLARRKSRFRYTLSEAASVRIKIQRAVVVAGHRRWKTTRTVVRTSRRGLNSVRVKVLIGKRGPYRALVRATDAAGNRSALKRVRFAADRQSGSRSR